MSEKRNKKIAKAARALAKEGQPVFPCRASGKKAKAPLTKNGFKDATDDKTRVRALWEQHPGAGIGIPTGLRWDVLDVDVKAGADGRVHLPRLNELGLLNGCQRLVRTPSGGYHLYFRASEGVKNRASATLGLDVRGRGGYVLAPPSFLETPNYEGSYELLEGLQGFTDEPLLWSVIRAALEPVDTKTNEPIMLLPSDRQANVAALREWLSLRQSGERNNALHWAVCRCIESGIDPHEMTEVAISIGLDEDETLLTIEAAMKRAGLTNKDLKTEGEAMFT